MMINSFKSKRCHLCGSENFIAYGHTKNGIQRYKCLDCGRSFTMTTNTIFDGHKIPLREWIDYLKALFNYDSYSNIADYDRDSLNTIIYWTNKVLLLLKDYTDDIVLEGRVYLDETFYSVRSEDLKFKDDGTRPRGLSTNKICIGIACDSHNTYDKVEGLAKTSMSRTKAAFMGHIREGSTLIHDKEKAHNILIRDLGLKSIVYDSRTIDRLDDSENPLYKINRKCFYLKEFLNSHKSFKRRKLQDLIDLFLFISNPPYDQDAKIDLILNLAFDKLIHLKYHDKY